MIEHNIIRKFCTNCGAGFLSLFCLSVFSAEQPMLGANHVLSFEKAIQLAQKNDPWLMGNLHKQRSIESMSTAVSALPDPNVSISLANLPTNGFDFNQEGMTQAKIGIAQRFPRGETLDIKSQQLRTQSEAFPFQRKDREAKVAVTVGTLWLNAYRIQQSIALIEKNRSLFEQLADVAEASYASAFGKTRQQDIVRAQLELTRLEDRLDKLFQQKNNVEGILAPWLTRLSIQSSIDPSIKASKERTTVSNTGEAADLYPSLGSDFSLHNLVLSQNIPQIALLNADLVNAKNWLAPEKLVRYFSNHPSVIAVDKQINASQTGIKLAKQKYHPEWGVNASYGYRADDPMGRSRADLFSVGVTFDLPIFTENRQDKEVQSAIYQTEAVKTKKLLLLKQLLGAYSSAKGRLLRLKDRQTLYKSKLLPQTHDQAEASLTAYTNDDGDFSEVVRSRIAVLNAEIDELSLNVEEQKLHLELNYLFIGRIKTAMTENNMNHHHKFTNSGQYVAISGEK